MTFIQWNQDNGSTTALFLNYFENEFRIIEIVFHGFKLKLASQRMMKFRLILYTV